MIKVSVMYPNRSGVRFAHEDHRDKHLPLMVREIDPIIEGNVAVIALKPSVSKQPPPRASVRKLTSCLRAVSLIAFVSFAATAHAAEENGDAAEVGKQLSNPISSVWALFTEFDLTFSDGDVNSGRARVGSRMIFQPILPVPLYGPAENRWNL